MARTHLAGSQQHDGGFSAFEFGYLSTGYLTTEALNHQVPMTLPSSYRLRENHAQIHWGESPTSTGYWKLRLPSHGIAY